MERLQLILSLMVLCLLAVAGVSAQDGTVGSPLEAYKNTCTVAETDIPTAARQLGVSVDELEYVNRGRDNYREAYLIKPGCFFSTELNRQPLYADTIEQYSFVIQIIEADVALTQIAPEGYFGDEGYSGYLLRDFSFAQDDAGRWLFSGMALLTGGATFGGHAVAFSGGGFEVRLEHDWIGQTFLHTTLVPEGPVVTSVAGYGTQEGPTAFSLRAIDYDSGDTLWEVDPVGTPLDILAASSDVVVVAYDAYVIAFSVADGAELWRVEQGSPRLAAGGGSLFIAGVSTLAAYDVTTGDPRWEIEISGEDAASPHPGHIVDVEQVDDAVIVALLNGRLAAYQIADGAPIWFAESTSKLDGMDLGCEALHGCWYVSANEAEAMIEQFSMTDGKKLAEYSLPGETSALVPHVRVQADGWVLITGIHLHARTPTLGIYP